MWELRKTHVHNRINQFYFKSFRPGVANLFEAACHNATKEQFVNHSVPTFVVVTQNNNFAVTIKVKTKQKNIKKFLDSGKHHFPHIVDVKTKMIKQKNPRLLKPLLFSQAIVCIERRLISGMRHVPVLMVSRATFKTCAVGSPPLIQEIRFSLNNTSFAIIFVSMPLNAKQIYIFYFGPTKNRFSTRWSEHRNFWKKHNRNNDNKDRGLHSSFTLAKLG